MFKVTLFILLKQKMTNYAICCLAELLLMVSVHTYTGDKLTEMLKDGLRNAVIETINSPVTYEKGIIPSWLSGTNISFVAFELTWIAMLIFYSCNFSHTIVSLF